MLKRQELMENFQTKLVEIGLHISWPIYLANNKKIYMICVCTIQQMKKDFLVNT